MSAKSSVTKIELKDDGVFLIVEESDPIKIADPVKVTAFGENDAEHAYTELTFQTRHGKSKIRLIPSSILTADTRKFITILSDHGYVWPISGSHRNAIIGQLSISQPGKTIRVTAVPGCIGETFVLPDENYSPEGFDRDSVRLCHNDNVGLGKFLRAGTQEDWKRLIGKIGRHSSRARLLMAASFAVPNMQALNVPTFGINLFGHTSRGKTVLLQLACSIPGLNDGSEPANWDVSAIGLEERALGHNGNIMPLDDASHLEDDPVKKAKFLKHAVFMLSGNRVKSRAGQYVKNAGLVQTPWRLIALSNSEHPLWSADETGKNRGERMRMIDVPACVSDLGDVFDGKNANRKIGSTVAERRQFAERLKEVAQGQQGEIYRAYLAKRFADPNATSVLSEYVAEYVSKTALTGKDVQFGRIVLYFAVIYASAALAIDYGLLPWSKKNTFRDIKRCMMDAIEQLRTTVVTEPEVSDEELVSAFVTKFNQAKFVRIKGATRKQILTAAGIVAKSKEGKTQSLLYSEILDQWFPEKRHRARLTSLLEDNGVLKRGCRKDTPALQKQIPQLGRRVSCYRILRKKVTELAK